jgi:hypothetical protein
MRNAVHDNCAWEPTQSESCTHICRTLCSVEPGVLQFTASSTNTFLYTLHRRCADPFHIACTCARTDPVCRMALPSLWIAYTTNVPRDCLPLYFQVSLKNYVASDSLISSQKPSHTLSLLLLMCWNCLFCNKYSNYKVTGVTKEVR